MATTITLTNEQYDALMRWLSMGSYIYGALRDSVDESYENIYQSIEDVSEHILWSYKYFGRDEDNIHQSDDGYSISDKYYDKIFEDNIVYDDYIMRNNLAHELTIKEIAKKHPNMLPTASYDPKKAQFRDNLAQKYEDAFMKFRADCLTFQIPKKSK